MTIKNKAAQELGRLGGKAKSQAKTEAARLNAKKPRKSGFGTRPRINGHWYWVTNGVDVWPAISDESASGGWCNDDTWEDWDNEVIAWKHLSKPIYNPIVPQLPEDDKNDEQR